ncbi:AraC family transcriptional regulator [Albibacterium bauzanense]|uniref:AraC family transcriptional regulator n=1 Tax=Albibacterium bauzanense TaxID=653929 RepID=A0A4V2PYD1_9SPHI|nr:AraC family transcriptional regulator [Albibacterium bauzanense]TCK85531.1 AraC family transcriptional regulator [Albibacterium bauzanense]
MKQSLRGKFYGQTNRTISLNGITLTDTVYTHNKVDWHYHEHAYFTFILEGNVIEGNKKEIYNCAPGSLLFHNWQEPHYNIKNKGFTRGFHLEIDKKWFDNLALSCDGLQGSTNILNPDIKLLMYKVFRATKIDDMCIDISIQSLLIEMLSKMNCNTQSTLHKMPRWVLMIDEILHDQFAETTTLDELSRMLDIHPIHLSRDFSKYFNCNLGEYIRKLKVEKALSLIALQNKSFTEIAYECGFSDQSHFTRCFKEFNGLNPSRHRKLLFT